MIISGGRKAKVGGPMIAHIMRVWAPISSEALGQREPLVMGSTLNTLSGAICPWTPLAALNDYISSSCRHTSTQHLCILGHHGAIDIGFIIIITCIIISMGHAIPD